MLREVLASLGIEITGAEELASVNTSIGDFVGGLRRAASALAAGLAVRELGQFVTETISIGDELDDTSARLGLSAQALQRWRFIAERSGSDANALGASLQRLQRSAFSASQGGASAQRAFRELGIDVRNANGQLKSGDVLMLELARSMGGLEDHTRAVGLAQVLMGRGGAALVPMLTAGEEGVRRLSERFDELGAGFSQELVTGAAEAQDSLTDFRLALASFRGLLAVSILPGFTRFVGALTQAVAWFRSVTESSNLLLAAFSVLGTALVILGLKWLFAFAIPITLGLLIVAGIAAIILVVEDLITAFQGGQSVIQEFYDEIMIAFGSTLRWADGVNNLGLVWDVAMARAREGIASVLESLSNMQQALGIEVFSGLEQTARDLRREAREATRHLSVYSSHQAAQMARSRRERLEPEQAGGINEILARPSRPTVPVRGRPSRRTAEVQQRIEAPINVNVDGGDPQRVVSAIERAAGQGIRRAIRDAAAALPQAGEEG